MLDQAFEALKTYDWGTDRKPLEEIDRAVIALHADEAAQKNLENRLAAVLKANVSRDSKDFICRKLMIIGTAASVPTLASLLSDKDLAHMARFALERIPAPEAAQALREALPKLDGSLKIGVISSLGVRRDAESVYPLAKLLTDSDPGVARAAAFALGDIRTSNAAKALHDAKSASTEVTPAVTDASLFCAEGLLAEGKKAEALAIFKAYTADDHPKHVRLAATKGMLACAGKNE
jgi:HEAT repeat protein